MKYLGIDYGAKKIGLALSDERGMIAFPHSVIPNDGRAVAAIIALITAEKVGGIVAGDTRTESGAENEITAGFSSFVDMLEREAGIEVALVREHGTTGAARAGLGENKPRGNIASPRKTPHDANLDARAAALILERHLDRMPKNGGTI